jgi:methyl-accepting chemotaxis protein
MRDSVVSFGGSLISGIRSIEITGGTAAAGRLRKGQEIVAGEGPSDEAFEAGEAELASENQKTLSTPSPKNAMPHSRGAIAHGIGDFSAAGHTLKIVGKELASPERWRSIDSTLDNLNRASESLSHTLERVSAVADSVSAHRERFYGQLDATISRLNHTLDEANKLFATSGRLMTSTDALVSSTSNAMDRDAAQIEQTLSQIDRTTRRLNETLQTVEPNPSSVIWGGWAGQKEPQ